MGKPRWAADAVAVLISNGTEGVVLRMPRDVWLDDKLCEIPSLHGAAVLEARIEELIELDVDHLAAVDMAGFSRVIDEIGGVDVVAPRMTDRRGRRLYEAGPVHLDGEATLAYSRKREVIMCAGRRPRPDRTSGVGHQSSPE